MVVGTVVVNADVHFRGMLVTVAAAMTLCSGPSPADAGPITIARGRRGDAPALFGVQGSFGGRYDNVRLCTATGPGTAGGPAGDIAAVGDFRLGHGMTLRARLPVLRPLLFALAFEMLQFEPDVALLWRFPLSTTAALMVGPLVGVTFHYGPDYQSDSSGAGRGPSFFALGPKVGGTVAIDWPRPSSAFGLQVGVSPYVAPLFGIDDPDSHRGVVVGGSLDVGMMF